MAEHQVDRPHGPLEALRAGEQVRQLGGQAVPGLGEAGGVVAQDVEHPEGQGRAAQVAGQVAVDAAEERDDPLQVVSLAHVLGLEGAALDQVEHEHARLGVEHGRRDAGGMGGPARGELVPAQDVVDGDVVADPHEAAALRRRRPGNWRW